MKKTLIAALTVSAVLACGYASASTHGNHHGNHRGFSSPYAEFDADRDGALNASEVKAMTQKLTEKAAKHESGLLTFEKADADKNGFVTLDELTVIMPNPEAPAADADKAKQQDSRKTGKADKRTGGDKKNVRYGRHGKNFGAHAKKCPAPCHAMFVLKAFDTNQDYKLDKNEYAKFIEAEKKHVAAERQFITALGSADLNGDGYVTWLEIDNVSHALFLKNAPAYKPMPAPQEDADDEADFPGEEEEEAEYLD
ncbi:MAG: hypothetical protein J6P70_02700 [Ruminobacter sp.]|nr:hypothetical protein [Ruminobacter sp.]